MDRATFPRSETTYHSFNDIELYEPASPPKEPSQQHGHGKDGSRRRSSRSPAGSHSSEDRSPTSVQMKRQDSGYESRNTTPRNSISNPRVSSPPRRRTSNSIHAAGGVSSRPRTRPSTRRSAKSYHHPNSSSVHVVKPQQQHPTVIHTSYFQFPSPDTETDDPLGPSISREQQGGPSQEPQQQQQPQMPPQPTHYWTSDRTRRLEYAAIDAASQGIKGWIKRNLLPSCLVPRDEHIPFDDDTGSVRRYRLELEDDVHADEKSMVPKRRTMSFWGKR